jgi:hypothetical protein
MLFKEVSRAQLRIGALPSNTDHSTLLQVAAPLWQNLWGRTVADANLFLDTNQIWIRVLEDILAARKR